LALWVFTIKISGVALLFQMHKCGDIRQKNQINFCGFYKYFGPKKTQKYQLSDFLDESSIYRAKKRRKIAKNTKFSTQISQQQKKIFTNGFQQLICYSNSLT